MGACGLPGGSRTLTCTFARCHASDTPPGDEFWSPRPESHRALRCRRSPGIYYPTGAWSGSGDLHAAAPASKAGGSLSTLEPVDVWWTVRVSIPLPSAYEAAAPAAELPVLEKIGRGGVI